MNKEVKKVLKDLEYSMRHDPGWTFSGNHASYSSGSGLEGLRDIITVRDGGWDYGVVIASNIRSAASPCGAELSVGWWGGRRLRRIIDKKIRQQEKEKLEGSCSIINSALGHYFCPQCGKEMREFNLRNP